MLNKQRKPKIWFIHGRPAPHPLHKKYGQSIGGELILVDPVLRWHDSSPIAPYKYICWFINAIYFAFKFRHRDIIVTEGVHITLLLTKRIAALWGKKIFVTALMADEFLYFLDTNFYKGTSAKYNQYFVQMYDHFFCIGDMVYVLCLKVIKSEEKLSKGFNGVSLERLQSLSSIEPRLDNHNIIFIGNGPSGWRAHYKGLDLLLQTFNKVQKQYKGACLYIVGDWDSIFIDSYIRKYCSSSEHNVHYVGRTNDLGNFLKKCCLYLHLGRGEAWGISINEAMAAGVVPIVSEWTGASECVRKVNEDLVVPLEIDSIVSKVLWYLSLTNEQKAMLSAKSKSIVQNYTESAAIEKFNQIFFEWYERAKD